MPSNTLPPNLLQAAARKGTMSRTSDLKTRRKKKKKKTERFLWRKKNLMKTRKSREKKTRKCRMLMLLLMKIPRCKASRIMALQFSLLHRLRNLFCLMEFGIAYNFFHMDIISGFGGIRSIV